VTSGECGEDQAATDQHQQPDDDGPAVASDMLPTRSLDRAPLRFRESTAAKPHHPQSAPSRQIAANIRG